MADRRLDIEVKLQGAEQAKHALKGIETTGVSATKSIHAGYIKAAAGIAAFATAAQVFLAASCSLSVSPRV